jgi:L-malate glycosyltransferase
MRINQVLVSASPGDAITNHAMELRSVLRRVCESEVYARFLDPALATEVLPLQWFDRLREVDLDADIIVFHASIGEPDVLDFLMERPERMVLMYHNISPADAFRDFDPAFAGLLDSGRQELTDLAGRTTMALAMSEFNAAELRALGYQDVRVSPLIVDVDRLRKAQPDPDTEHHLRTMIDGPLILYVGQLLPHKRPDLLIKAYHVLVTYLMPKAHLVLVGAGRLPKYSETLQLLTSELNLPRAWIAGPVTEAQLAAFYNHASVFATASEHEGFCAPLVEAMACDVPIVARAFAAIPETLGGAGLLLPDTDDPVLFAEALCELLENDATRKEFIRAGRHRLEAFDADRARAVFLSHLEDLI